MTIEIDEDPGGRTFPPNAGTELEMLNTFLDFHRQTLLWKVRGADEADLRRPVIATSTMTLLGLVKHIAYVERQWFQHRFKGDTVTFPWTRADPDADWRVEQNETTDGIIQFYLDECARSRQIVSEASLDDLEARSWPTGEKTTLRWIMYHMVEETARHNGHADLLREAIDGETGE